MSKLIEQIKRHEGLMLKPYTCPAGKLTIGYGRNIEDVGITGYEAEMLLSNDLSRVVRSLYSGVRSWNLIDSVRQDVLINMAFNMGVTGLLKFKKTLGFILDKDFKMASLEMLDSKWARQVPQRAMELSEQMLSGEYS